MNENRVSPDVKSRFVGVFTSVVVHLYALYAFKSKEFGGGIGVITTSFPLEKQLFKAITKVPRTLCS